MTNNPILVDSLGVYHLTCSRIEEATTEYFCDSSVYDELEFMEDFWYESEALSETAQAIAALAR